MKILILGAGPTGLGAAYHLNKLGYTDWQLFEQENHVGGLSTSYLDENGFTWDVGGHVLFSHYDYFDNVVAETLGDEYYEHQRESWVRILKTWVPYPFQNNVRYLPDDALKECIEGLQKLHINPLQANNFREWMDSVFGSGIVKYFMKPYNNKVWALPLEEMSKEWIVERVSVVDLARIEKNISEKRDDLSWGPNNVFKFPMQGGTGSIYERIADKFRNKIYLNNAMESVDVDLKKVTFTNGRVELYDVLINTIPLDLFVKCSAGIPHTVLFSTDSLIHNGGLIVGLGYKAKRVDSKCWMYFPEVDSPFYRVTNFHNYSPYNVPDFDLEQYFSFMCETSYSTYKPESKNEIIEKTIQGLITSGMIDAAQRERIISRFLIDIPYSYPVPTLGRDKALNLIQPFLELKDVYSRGRFGAWRYEIGNMDHSFMQGVEVVERILYGKYETVFNSK